MWLSKPLVGQKPRDEKPHGCLVILIGKDLLLSEYMSWDNQASSGAYGL